MSARETHSGQRPREKRTQTLFRFESSRLRPAFF